MEIEKEWGIAEIFLFFLSFSLLCYFNLIEKRVVDVVNEINRMNKSKAAVEEVRKERGLLLINYMDFD